MRVEGGLQEAVGPFQNGVMSFSRPYAWFTSRGRDEVRMSVLSMKDKKQTRKNKA